MQKKVLLTGVSGWIGKHTAIELLKSGYNVLGTVRDEHLIEPTKETIGQHASTENLSFAVQDLLNDGWDDIVEGCNYVIHMASPYPLKVSKNINKLIPVAKDGTIRVLKAALKSKIEQIVLTSSFVAMIRQPNRAVAFSFGEYDSSGLYWTPKSSASIQELTFGTNGFYLDFKASDNLGNDANGGTDWGETNLAATDQSIDTCTNNFATLNPLAWTTGSGLAFSDGNLKLVNSDNGWRPAISNIAVTKGKWVAEVKVVAVGSASKYGIIDVLQYNDESNLFYNLATGTRAWTYRAFQGKVYNNTSDAGGSSYGNSFTTNDIIGIYLDCDNNKIYWSKNGVVQNSGTGISITDGYDYAFALNLYNSTAEINFGSPSYSITSGNTDGEFGNFEYSTTITGDGASKVFKALCTKNLAEYGG